MEESTLDSGALTKQVTELLAAPQRCEEMGRLIRERFACPDANERIYDQLMKLLK